MIDRTRQKRTGAFYTPDPVASSLVSWAVRRRSDRMLDPACGDGRFISQHPNSVGVEQDRGAIRIASMRAPRALVYEGEFFDWAVNATERFDCAAGNPPFIRYQAFNGKIREQALSFCSGAGVKLSRLASSWAPFIVAAARLLRPNGRLAFVVPAEIGHAP